METNQGKWSLEHIRPSNKSRECRFNPIIMCRFEVTAELKVFKIMLIVIIFNYLKYLRIATVKKIDFALITSLHSQKLVVHKITTVIVAWPVCKTFAVSGKGLSVI